MYQYVYVNLLCVHMHSPVHHLYSFPQHLQPHVMVEDAVVRLGEIAMLLSETSSDHQRLFELWSHFASQLVFFYFMQLVNTTSLLNKLRTKVSHLVCVPVTVGALHSYTGKYTV